MPIFYFNGVSTTGKKRIDGKFEADDEKTARNLLNKIGVSVLMLSEREPPNWGKDPTKFIFEYEAKDRLKAPIKGMIEASGSEEVYDRLTNEFGFEVTYICKERAGEEEKARAHKEGVRQILQDKARKAALDADEKKRTLKGGLETLMEMAEGKHKKSPAMPILDLTEEDEMRENQADGESEQSSGTQPNQAALKGQGIGGGANEEDKINKIALGKIGSGTPAQKSAVAGKVPKIDSLDMLKKNLITTLKVKLNLTMGILSRAYYHFTEIIVPKMGKSRLDAWQDFKKLVLPKKEEMDAIELQHVEESRQHRKEIFERFWGNVEITAGMLGLVFGLYYAVGLLVLYFDIGGYYHFAEKTIQSTTLIPFTACASALLWVIMFLKDKVTRLTYAHFSAMLLGSGVILLVLGINFLY